MPELGVDTLNEVAELLVASASGEMTAADVLGELYSMQSRGLIPELRHVRVIFTVRQDPRYADDAPEQIIDNVLREALSRASDPDDLIVGWALEGTV
jgi:hypothetical protein